MSTAPRYVGERFARADAHDGALPHVVGVSSYQVLRACREDIDSADGFGNTYNHAPMLTYWRDKFYLSYTHPILNAKTDMNLNVCLFLYHDNKLHLESIFSYVFAL